MNNHRAVAIQTALSQLAGGGLLTGADTLFKALGYRSERRLDGQTGDVNDFIAAFPARQPDTESERFFCKNVAEVRVLFQLTDTEITAEDGIVQGSLLDDASSFNSGNIKSFLFSSVQLTGVSYPRHRYAAFTREINKRVNGVPVVVLFRTADNLVTLAFVYRRPGKVHPDRQVLGSVSLIREIPPPPPPPSALI